jgi:hypothetical protein
MAREEGGISGIELATLSAEVEPVVSNASGLCRQVKSKLRKGASRCALGASPRIP